MSYLVSISAYAYDIEVDGIYYDINIEDRTVSVNSGEKQYEGHVIIPSSILYGNQELPVVSILKDAFSNCEKLESIEIPNSITEIGSGAFRGTRNLKEVYISDLTSWCNIEFDGTNNPLYSGYAKLFLNNSEVKNLIIPETVSVINDYAFARCSSIETVTFSSSLTKIGDTAFYVNENLKEIKLPDSVISIGSSCFSNCKSLASVVLPNSLESLPNDCFYYCTNLKSVKIPNSVKSISYRCFKGCSSLQSIEIPNSVERIYFECFSGCTSLQSIEIPNSVKIIENSCFSECTSLQSIEIPSSVTNIGYSCFSGCTSLRSINLPESLTEINHETFKNSGLEALSIPNWIKTIGSNIVDGCENLKYLSIPKSVTSYKADSFDGCENLEVLIIDVEEIESKLFQNYTNLKYLEIGDNVNTIHHSTFIGCTNLKTLYISEGEKDLAIVWGAFQNTVLENIFIGRKTIFSSVNFTGLKVLSLGKNIESIFIGDTSEELEVINSYSMYPPELYKSGDYSGELYNFSSLQYANVIVNIPEGSLQTYLGAPMWRNFWNLHEGFPNEGVEKIILNIENTELEKSQTLQLEAIVLPENVTDKTVYWQSSNPDIASVTDTGLVTALKEGTAVITATCGEASATCVVTVISDAGIDSLMANPDAKISVYSLSGILIRKNCLQEDLKSLPKGIYIIVSGKERYKISI